jgi:acyl carrier protein
MGALFELGVDAAPDARCAGRLTGRQDRLIVVQMDELLDTVAAAAARHLPPDGRDQLRDPDSELRTLGLDSLRVVAFMVDLEATCDITFPAELLVPDTFHSIRTVATAVASLTSLSGGQAR